MRAHARVCVRMCVVLQVLSRSVVLLVLGRMCVVLQVLGLLQVLVLVLVLGRVGVGPSLLIAVQPPIKLYFCQSWASPEPQNKYILYDTGTTPESKKRYLSGMS